MNRGRIIGRMVTRTEANRGRVAWLEQEGRVVRNRSRVRNTSKIEFVFFIFNLQIG
jgi:hypothetical protein